jgi:hypothetical protein
MQTWFLFYDVKKSAAALDRNRLGAQIYEGVHILASLLGVNEKLVNPKRSVAKHPIAKLWNGYECHLFNYIVVHLREWQNRGYQCGINLKNMYMIMSLRASHIRGYEVRPPWVDEELIKSHREKLIVRLPSHYEKIFLDNPGF